MNEALDKAKTMMFNNWLQQKKRSITFKGVIQKILPSLRITHPVVTAYLDEKVGKAFTGPMSMHAMTVMLTKKGLTSRIIYKALPNCGSDGIGLSWVYPTLKNRKRPYPYADREDIKMLKDSGMSLVVFIYKISKEEHKYKENVLQPSIMNGSFDLKNHASRRFKTIESVGHVVTTGGDGFLVSNSHVPSNQSISSHIRSVNRGVFDLETILSMGPVGMKWESLGFLAYEVIPHALLDEREREHATKCAESLLHLESVVGCNAKAEETRSHYSKLDPTNPNSACRYIP